MDEKEKLKILRVITAPEVIKFHLKNFLKFCPRQFDVVVVGSGVTKYQGQYPHIRFVDLEIPRKINLIQDFKALLGLIKIFRYEKPDVVHSIMPKSGLLAALAAWGLRVPVRLHTFTGQVWATRKGPMRWFLKKLDQLIVALNTLCLTDSPSQSQFLFENQIESEGLPLHVLGKGCLDGVDLSIFSPEKLKLRASEFRRQHKIQDTDFVFLYVGRKTLDKGVDLLLEAFFEFSKKNPDCFLLYVGPSEVDDPFHQYPLVNPRLIPLGFTHEPEVCIAASQVACLPSLREGFGNSVVECGALGVPTLGSRIPGLVDSIQHEKTGLLFCPGSKTELLDAMNRIFSDQAFFQQLSKNSRSFVQENFEAQKMTGLTFQLYKTYFHQSTKGRKNKND